MNKWIMYEATQAICWWTLLEGLCPGVNKSIGSLLFLPSTFPSLCSSSHTNGNQGSSFKKKTKVTKSDMEPSTGTCVDKVDQTLSFCWGDAWNGPYELVVHVVDVFLGCNNPAKVKLYFLLLISNLGPPPELGDRKSSSVQCDLTQNSIRTRLFS